MWNKKKNIIQRLLPTEPKDFEFGHWWIVKLAPSNEEDYKVGLSLAHRKNGMGLGFGFFFRFLFKKGDFMGYFYSIFGESFLFLILFFLVLFFP